MAEAATKSGAPARTRKPAAASATKAAAKPAQKPPAAPKTAAKPAAATKAAEAPPADDRVKVLLEFEFIGDTKTYAKFQPPADSGCVGTVYAPLGTDEVKVLLVSPAEVAE